MGYFEDYKALEDFLIGICLILQISHYGIGSWYCYIIFCQVESRSGLPREYRCSSSIAIAVSWLSRFLILISVIKAFTAFAAFLCTSASLYSCACHAISFRWHIFAAIKSSISFKLLCWYALLSVKFSSSDLRPCGWCQLKSDWDRRGLSGVSQSLFETSDLLSESAGRRSKQALTHLGTRHWLSGVMS